MDLPNPGIKPRSPTLQVDSSPTEPAGKLKNTGVGSLLLPQGIFPTQESNRGFLHCKSSRTQPQTKLVNESFVKIGQEELTVAIAQGGCFLPVRSAPICVTLQGCSDGIPIEQAAGAGSGCLLAACVGENNLSSLKRFLAILSHDP